MNSPGDHSNQQPPHPDDLPPQTDDFVLPVGDQVTEHLSGGYERIVGETMGDVGGSVLLPAKGLMNATFREHTGIGEQAGFLRGTAKVDLERHRRVGRKLLRNIPSDDGLPRTPNSGTAITNAAGRDYLVSRVDPADEFDDHDK